MSKRSVHIANLRIRIPHSMAGQAKAIANGLGRQILHGIAAATAGKSGSTRIDATDPVKVRAGGTVDVRGLQEQAAALLAQQLCKRFE